MISTGKIFRRFSRSGDPPRTPPRWIFGLLFVALGMQLVWGVHRSAPLPKAVSLSAPPSPWVLRLTALGDTAAFSRLLMLWLQNFDNQPGLALPMVRMDYSTLSRWLAAILTLDPRGESPLFAAMHFYLLNPDPKRVRIMLDFIHQQFFLDPKTRWRWLAFAAVNARHRLNDNALALQYLNDLTDKVHQESLPQWILGVRLSVMQTVGELESARLLVGGMLHNHAITSETEIRFLSDWLEMLEKGRPP